METPLGMKIGRGHDELSSLVQARRRDATELRRLHARAPTISIIGASQYDGFSGATPRCISFRKFMEESVGQRSVACPIRPDFSYLAANAGPVSLTS